MRVEQAISVVTILRTGSFREAARELEVSQSALSETVRNLERELGVTLLERGRGGVTPTETGERVRPYLEEIATATGRLREEIALAAVGGRYRLRIGAVTAAVNTLLPGAVSDLLTTLPGVQTQVIAAGSLDIRVAVLAGRLDAGLVTVTEAEAGRAAPGLVLVPLLRCGLVVCAPAGHPFAESGEVDPARLRDERLIAYRPGYLMHDVIEELLGAPMPNVVYRTDNTNTAKTMIAAGVGVTVLPEFSVVPADGDLPRKLVLRPLGGPPVRIALAAIHRADDDGEPVRTFAELLLRRADHSATSVSTSVRSTL